MAMTILIFDPGQHQGSLDLDDESADCCTFPRWRSSASGCFLRSVSFGLICCYAPTDRLKVSFFCSPVWGNSAVCILGNNFTARPSGLILRNIHPVTTCISSKKTSNIICFVEAGLPVQIVTCCPE